MMEVKENYSSKEIVEKNKEKERQPRKIIVLIRHPKQQFMFKQSKKLAVKEAEDIETNLPISVKGLRQIRKLSEYMVKEFPWPVDSKEYAIYASPVKRARHGADILETRIRLKIADGVNIPVPVNNNREILECFSEVVFAADKETDARVTGEAKKRGADVIDTWLDLENEKLLPRFQNKFEDIRQGFDYLKKKSTKVDLVVSHHLAIAVAIWATDNSEKFKDEKYQLTMNDLKEIIGYSKKISHTSMTEFNVYDDGIRMGKVGVTPHLDENR
jgi:broad specificity phosphatase PhoE